MRFHFMLSLIAVLRTVEGISQDLSQYKYVYVPTLTYSNKKPDKWNISSRIRKKFKRVGFEVLADTTGQLPIDLISNPCLLLTCTIHHTKIVIGTNAVNLKLIDCDGQVILKCHGEGMSWSVRADYRLASKRAFEKIKNCLHESSLTENSSRTL